LFFRFDASPEVLNRLARGIHGITPAASGGFRSVIPRVVDKGIVGKAATSRPAASPQERA
jgi:hypothetical protein